MKEKLSFTEGGWLKEPSPTTDEMAAVFGLTNNWLYLGGHFSVPFENWGNWQYASEKRLYNDLDNKPETSPTREILIRSDHLLLRTKAGSGWSERTLTKGAHFKQTACNVVLFGGCAIAERKADILAFQSLFNKPLILGWKKTTSRQMINLMLGGNGTNGADGSQWSNVNFWANIGQNFNDLAKVRISWLETANSIFTAGDPFRSHFAVIDSEYIYSLDAPPQKITDLVT